MFVKGWRVNEVVNQDTEGRRVGKIRGSVGDVPHLKNCRTDRKLEAEARVSEERDRNV